MIRTIGATVITAALVAGCGSSAADGVATLTGGNGSTSTSTTAPSDADREENALKFAQCMRENGIKDFPDPQIDSEGNVRFMIRRQERPADDATSAPEFDRAQIDKAREACAEYAEDLRSGFSEEDQTRLQDAMLEYAKCMRENGYDMPDPEFSGRGGPGPGAVTEIRPDDPVFKKADEACRDKLSQLPMRFGPGPAPRGAK